MVDSVMNGLFWGLLHALSYALYNQRPFPRLHDSLLRKTFSPLNGGKHGVSA